MKKNRRARLIVFGVIVAVIWGYLYFRPKPTGIYLAHGGTNYYKISRTLWGGLKVKTVKDPSIKSVKATYRGGKLKITYVHKKDLFEIPGTLIAAPATYGISDFIKELWKKRLDKVITYMHFTPSQTIDGDWDMILFCPYGWRSKAGMCPPLTRPVYSYLHKIDDKRIPAFFSTILEEKNTPEALAIAQDLFNDYPDDVYVRTLFIAALFEDGNPSKARTIFEDAKAAYSKTEDESLRLVDKNIRKILLLHETNERGENAYEYYQKMLGDSNNLDYRLQHYPNLLKYRAFMMDRKTLPLGFRLHYRHDDVPDFFQIQIDAKVNRVMATMWLSVGKREESLELLASNYHIAKLLNESTDTLIARLIGVAVRQISVRALELYALNACETDEDFRQVWNVLEDAKVRYVNSTVVDAINVELPLSHLMRPDTPSIVLGNFRDAETREDVADAKFELLRMATVAKWGYVTNEAFPKEASDFARFFPDGIPADPFGDGPLKFFEKTDEGMFICYSLGPDATDDAAAVEYSPTNGTLSGGDIITKIPRQRQFPFPREGVRANTAEEIRQLFPNGLPIDVFSNSKTKPLGISDTTPIYIWSYGPDVDETIPRMLTNNGATEAMYDPTNGVVSEGDLFIQIPTRDSGKD